MESPWAFLEQPGFASELCSQLCGMCCLYLVRNRIFFFHLGAPHSRRCEDPGSGAAYNECDVLKLAGILSRYFSGNRIVAFSVKPDRPLPTLKATALDDTDQMARAMACTDALLNNRREFLQSVEAEESRRGRRYEWVAVLRMDYEFLALHPPLDTLARMPGIWVPLGEDWDLGFRQNLNDRYAIFSREHARTCLLVDVNVTKIAGLHMEKALAIAIRDSAVPLHRFSAVGAVVVSSDIVATSPVCLRMPMMRTIMPSLIPHWNAFEKYFCTGESLPQNLYRYVDEPMVALWTSWVLGRENNWEVVLTAVGGRAAPRRKPRDWSGYTWNNVWQGVRLFSDGPVQREHDPLGISAARSCALCSGSPDEFDCGDGVCVLDWFRCDGTRDCRSGDDEANCPPRPEMCQARRTFSTRAKTIACRPSQRAAVDWSKSQSFDTLWYAAHDIAEICGPSGCLPVSWCSCSMRDPYLCELTLARMLHNDLLSGFLLVLGCCGHPLDHRPGSNHSSLPAAVAAIRREVCDAWTEI
mmetsp:Transcript_14772/g.32826  ORF Transcript_14772/g.32826 Transcript_14772/m.32826 type:complete len:526 (-) Transcript_14772:21-1598(-)